MFNKELLSDKKFLAKCKEKDSNSKQLFIEAYSQFIYTYPIRITYKIPIYNIIEAEKILSEYISNINNVELGEFYLAMIDKIRECKIFSSYNFDRPFRPYFERILYYQFVDIYNKICNCKKKEIPIEDENYSGNETIDNEIAELSNKENEELDKIEIETIIKLLKIKERALFKLRWLKVFELTADELNWLADELNLSINELIEKINFLLVEHLEAKEIPYLSLSNLLKKSENALMVEYCRIYKKIKENFRKFYGIE